MVTWVEGFLKLAHFASGSNMIMDDIDHWYVIFVYLSIKLIENSLALVPPFGGLRSFPNGQRFKQWTGDDSKALMKVSVTASHKHRP